MQVLEVLPEEYLENMEIEAFVLRMENGESAEGNKVGQMC